MGKEEEEKEGRRREMGKEVIKEGLGKGKDKGKR